MQKEEAKNLLKKMETGYSLPALSVIATKLIEIASNENASIKELAELIEKDPALTVRLISTANSAFFRTSELVTSIEQAIFRIGFKRLRIMALTLSLRDTFPMGKRGKMDYEHFWKVSLYRALLCRSLAAHFKNCNPEEAFIAGLTQEIGFLVFYDLIMSGDDEIAEHGLFPIEDLLSIETDKYGINHREVGEIALRYWKFPEEIVKCQNVLEEKKPSPLCLNCEIALLLSSIIFQSSIELNEILDKITNVYKINSELTSEILSAVFNQVEDTARAFKLEVNKDRDIIGIMENANKILGKLSSDLESYHNSKPEYVLPSFKSLQNLSKTSAVDHTIQAVAHEIRNPLVSVGGFVKKLSKVIDTSSKEWEYVQIILEETRKIEQVIARFSEGKLNNNS
ncbi:MAG: HDOD domain-containing protein [Nitrospirae bacterium]|jgi:HD-like signal output (HDOD) protein|nr:HDOD domain-containing protein [Nitrospirota bacterium]